MKQIFICLSIILICISATIYGTAMAESPEPSNQERYELALDTWLDKLFYCESSNNPNAINKKDSDGKPAYGLGQYKLGTFLSLSKKYNVYPDLTVDMVHAYAMDGEKSYHLTKEVMMQNPKEAGQWGCTKKIGGYPPTKEEFGIEATQ